MVIDCEDGCVAGGLGAIAMPKYLNNRASSIYAGSNEIQRDLIARVVVDQAA